MPRKRITGYIAGGVLVLAGLYTILTYNSLVNKEENVKKNWSEVQNTYQRRLDLVPNLVNVVKGISGFEQSTLEKIATARAEAMKGIGESPADTNNLNQQQRLQDTIAATANRVIAVIEKYPELKGTAAYAGLQVQLEGTERRIKVARNNYNASVNEYNKKVRGFPSNIIALIFGFSRKTGFMAEEGSDKAIEINFKQ